MFEKLIFFNYHSKVSKNTKKVCGIPKLRLALAEALKTRKKVKRPKEAEEKKKMVSPGLPCGRQKPLHLYGFHCDSNSNNQNAAQGFSKNRLQTIKIQEKSSI